MGNQREADIPQPTPLRTSSPIGMFHDMTATGLQSFQLKLEGPDGLYLIDFAPTGKGEGKIEVSIAGHQMTWPVEGTSVGDSDREFLGGMTVGSEVIWGSVFWFELHLNNSPPLMRYWGDKAIWREDLAVLA